jgi:hypothetical protein
LITLDTSAIVALQDRKDARHAEAVRVLEVQLAPAVVPSGILAEIAYLLDRRLPGSMDRILASIEDGSLAVDCGDHDIPRVRELMTRYADLRLGFADSVVISCAERNGGKVVTFDRRDFDVVAREGTIVVLPEPA